jgi:GH35 family endo-1,4-beta-xylanase
MSSSLIHRYSEVFLWVLSSVVLVFLISSAHADNLLPQDRWQLQAKPEDAELALLKSDQIPLGAQYGWQITIKHPVNPFYKIMLGQSIQTAIPAGHRIKLTFWACSPDNNMLHAVIEKSTAPYISAGQITTVLTKGWKRCTLIGTSPGYEADGLSVRIQVGYQKGVIQLADLYMEDIGFDPAIAAAQNAIEPKNIAARIKQYRMGELQIIVKDNHGHPVNNASIHVEMTKSAFLFGCNIFLLNPDNKKSWQLEYQRKFAALFNYATLPFYWGSFEFQEGKPQYDKLDAMVRWCQQHNITCKGHPLVWHEVYPAWAPNDPDQAIPLLHKRVQALITHYKGQISYWDVLNEANSAASVNNGEGAWIKRDGAANVIAEVLKWAREAARGANDTFIYNDFNTGQDNLNLLTKLKSMGELPDAIGIQSHMHQSNWPLTQLWLTADNFSHFGIPVHFTETTVVSGPHREVSDSSYPNNWVTTPEGEQTQADYLVKFYSILFSHPNVRAITYWDFSDRGAWLNAPAGLLRKDMSSKPVYDRLMDLIHHQWSTLKDGITTSGGKFRLNAFYGDYQIKVKKTNGKETIVNADFPMGCGKKTVEIILK